MKKRIYKPYSDEQVKNMLLELHKIHIVTMTTLDMAQKKKEEKKWTKKHEKTFDEYWLKYFKRKLSISKSLLNFKWNKDLSGCENKTRAGNNIQGSNKGAVYNEQIVLRAEDEFNKLIRGKK